MMFLINFCWKDYKPDLAPMQTVWLPMRQIQTDTPTKKLVQKQMKQMMAREELPLP